MLALDRSRPGIRLFLLVRILAALLSLGAAVPASANVKTVNTISAEVNMNSAQRGVAYSQFILPSGGGGAPYTFALLSGTLPEGFSLSAAGELNGTNCTAVNGSYPFEVRITSSTGTVADFTGTSKFSVQMTAGPGSACAITVAALPTTGTVGVAYSGTASASGGSVPYTWSIVAGSLPTGVTLDSSTGVVSGTPTTAGTYSFTLKAADGSGNSGVTNYSVTIAAPGITLTPASVPGGKQNLAYTTQTITASGGSAPYTYAVTAGALPAGIMLAADGTLAGTPTASGTFNFTVTATDNLAATGSRAYTLVVSAVPTITLSPATLTDALQALAYSQVITASGGTAAYTYAVTAGALPAGLALAADGTLSGTPTASGTFNFTVTATDADTYTGSRAYTLVVTATPTITLSPVTLPDGSQSLAYSQAVTASGGTAAYSYAITAGALPAGLTLASTGTLAGTPTASGTFNFTVTATDANTYTGSQAYTLVVVAAPTITLTPTTLPDGSQHRAYTTQSVTASGGTAAYSYAVTAGALPTGLTLATNGALAGTPTASGTFNFTITATDASTYTGARAYTLVVVAAPTITVSPTTLPDGLQAIAYSQAITASGGTAPYAYALTAGSLPDGLTLTAGGSVSGTPTASGTFNFTITATDADTYTGSRAYTVTVSATPTISISPTTLPSALQDIAFGSQAITAAGGTAPYGYAVTAGALPAGMALNGGGLLSGTPTASGTFNFTVTATDANSYTGSQAYTLTVSVAPSMAISPTTLPDALQNMAYGPQAISASGGTAPYTYSVTTGALPGGLTLASGGSFAGTPTASGTFNFTITVTDAHGYTSAQAYTLVVTAAPTIVVSPTTLPDALQNMAYGPQAISASGGTAPYTYAVTTGALPAGLTLTSGGSLAGTPTASGTFNITITVTDANGYTSAQAYTLVVTAAPTITIGPDTLPEATEGTSYSATVVPSGGTAGYACAVTAGAVPPGMTLGADCVLSGTPTTRGGYDFTVTVTDANGYTSSRTYTFAVTEPMAAAPNDPVPAIDSSGPIAPFTPVAPVGGVGPYNYEIAPALPDGLVFDPATGSISGTPTANKPMTTYTVTITDSLGDRASQDFAMAVVVYTIDLTPTTIDIGRAGLPADAQFDGIGGVGPYVITLESGSLPPGMALGGDGHLSGTPAQSGTFVVQLRVTDANGITAVSTVTLNVDAPRPDPTQDAGVRALQEAQADSLRRFGMAQTQNTARRLEALRGCSASRNELNVAIGEQGTLAAGQVADQARAANCDQARAVWLGGTITYTEASPGGASDLVTDGLTIGLDTRVTGTLTIGVGLGLSREGEKELAGDARLSGDGYNALAYASWEAMPRFFVEGVVGYGTASYDHRRLVADDGVFAAASRDASHWFVSAGVAGVVDVRGASVQPYLRADYQSADLDAYTERSVSTLALAYDSANTDTTRYTAGLRANWSLPMTFGTIAPLLRLEYRGESRSGLSQGMRYADGLDGIDYTLRASSTNESSGIAGAGIGVQWLRGISAEIEYQTSFGSSLPQEQSLGAHLNWSF